MADLSIYLFWTGFAFALLSFAVHVASVAGRLAGRAATAETGFGSFAVPVEGEHPRQGLVRLGTTLAGLTALALGGSVASRWAAVDHAPVSNLYEFTTAFAFGVAAAYVAFAAASRQSRFGLIALPIVAAMLAIAATFPSDITPLVPALQNPTLLTIHVTTMMASYAVLTVSFCAAVVYLVQGGERRRRVAWLPSGEAAADLAHRSVTIGFPLLGLGIALGAWWANSAWGRYWGWDPKETSALVTWLAIAAYFHARAGTGSVAGAAGVRRLLPARIRRGRRPDPMWWLVVMWGLVMFTYFGVNLWISGLHSYAGV